MNKTDHLLLKMSVLSRLKCIEAELKAKRESDDRIEQHIVEIKLLFSNAKYKDIVKTDKPI